MTYTGTWHNLRDSIILLLKTFKVCDADDCEACSAVHDLLRSPRVQKFMRSDEYNASQLLVDATWCDLELGFHTFTHEEFGFEANV